MILSPLQSEQPPSQAQLSNLAIYVLFCVRFYFAIFFIVFYYCIADYGWPFDLAEEEGDEPQRLNVEQ